jgi:hypothetical protein
MTLLDQIDRMNDVASELSASASEVSGWTVGQQIEHCCLTVRATVVNVVRSRNETANPSLTIVGRRIFASGQIPRGRAQAPASVVVESTPSHDELVRSLKKAREGAERLDPHKENGFFDHPYFGRLDQAQCIQYLEIHNAHHLAIIDDILAAV